LIPLLLPIPDDRKEVLTQRKEIYWLIHPLLSSVVGDNTLELKGRELSSSSLLE